jgi:hypothetical protein
MATITGMTAEAMLAIRDQTVVSGAFDSASHLILTKYDGTQIDAGAVLTATTGQAGVVELATSAETITGTDGVRAVTPAGIAAKDQAKVLDPASFTNSTPVASYPLGESFLSFTTSQATTAGWTFGGKAGTIKTYGRSGGSASQLFIRTHSSTTTPEMWFRGGDSSGWGAWQQAMNLSTLAAASFTQTTAFTSYPVGQSRIYYTAANSSAWGFSGKAGEVLTYSDGSDFAKQTWTKHGGSGTDPEIWTRTANSATGWSNWLYVSGDSGWVNMTYSSGITAGTAEQIQYRVKNGVIFFRGGGTGTFAAGAYQNIVEPGAIPSAYRPAQNVRGGATGTGMRPCGYEINIDGSIKLGSNGLSSQPTWIAFAASYPVG